MKFSLCLLAVLGTSLFAIPLSGQTTPPPTRSIALSTDDSPLLDVTGLFVMGKSDRKIARLDRVQAPYAIFHLDGKTLDRLNDGTPKALEFQLPGVPGRAVLTPAEIFAPGFTAVNAATGRDAGTHHGRHYRGSLAGQPGSFVALSVFHREISGLIVSADGATYSLGKLADDKTGAHILYNEKGLPERELLSCGTPDDGLPYRPEELLPPPPTGRGANNCINIHVDVDRDLIRHFGNLDDAAEHVTGLFNQAIAFYANENVDLRLSGITYWTQESVVRHNNPFNNEPALHQYRVFRNYNPTGADLNHLLRYYPGGGGIAYVRALCSQGFNFGLSRSTGAYEELPHYSTSLNVLAHELGHNLGSQHTHACSWNGNGTAIDECHRTEGNCAGNEVLPAAGGTVMSYCYLTSAGNNLSLGLGRQPGNIIRNSVYNAPCLTTCGEAEDACPYAATTVALENGDGASSVFWYISDENGNVIDYYIGPAEGDALSTNVCLDFGCYVLGTQFVFTNQGPGTEPLMLNLSVGGETHLDVPFTGGRREVDFCVYAANEADGDITECTAIDLGRADAQPHGHLQDRGEAILSQDAHGIRLEGNAWKSVPHEYIVTPNTMLSLRFKAGREGDIQGIGLANSGDLNLNRLFKLRGTQSSGGFIAFGEYSADGQYQYYDIPIGAYYTGWFDRIFFANDHDVARPDARSTYRNIRLYEREDCSTYPPFAPASSPICDPVDFDRTPAESYGINQDRGLAAVHGSERIRLSGNAWKSIPGNYRVKENTRLRFEFMATRPGEIQGIGFDDDQEISAARLFKLAGSQQNWPRTEFYEVTEDELGQWFRFDIPVGQFYTGTFSHLVLANDKDGGDRDAECLFRNIELLHGERCAPPPGPGGNVHGNTSEPGAYARTTLSPTRDLTVYPNPASEALRVRYGNTGAAPVALTVYDMTGRPVRTRRLVRELPSGKVEIPLSGLPAGPYLLQLTAADGTRRTARFAVAR